VRLYSNAWQRKLFVVRLWGQRTAKASHQPRPRWPHPQRPTPLPLPALISTVRGIRRPGALRSPYIRVKTIDPHPPSWPLPHPRPDGPSISLRPRRPLLGLAWPAARPPHPTPPCASHPSPPVSGTRASRPSPLVAAARASRLSLAAPAAEKAAPVGGPSPLGAPVEEAAAAGGPSS
jgi:hypothetical protein